MPRVQRWSALWPSAAVAAIVLVAWLACGTALTEILRFVGYEVWFLLVPGVILVAFLTPGRKASLLERLFLGYVVGIAIEIAAFTVTAALDKRAGLPLYPLPAYLLALIMVMTGRWRLPRGLAPAPTPPKRAGWLGAGVACAVTVCLVMGFFISNPLARTVDSVAYDQDLVYHLALSAEAKDRWPTQDPNIAGESLHYHTFANRDMAAVSRVTEIPLDVVLLRLMPVAMLLALGAGIALLTLRLSGSTVTASLAVALALIAGELDVDTKLLLPFLSGSLLTHLQSPSFYLGALFFLGALYVLIEHLGFDRSEQVRPGSLEWWGGMAVLAIVVGGASGAKANVIPVLVGGLALFWAVDLAWTRRLRLQRFLPLGLLMLGFAISYVLLYRGGAGHGFDVLPVHFGRAVWPGASWVGGTAVEVLALVAALAPLAGMVALVTVRRGRLRRAEALLACMFVVALGAFMLLSQPGGAEIYFLLYGTLAGTPISALGVTAAWDRVPASRRRRVAVWLLAGGVGMLIASAIGAAVLGSWSTPKPKKDLFIAGMLVLVAFVAASVIYAVALRGTRRLSVVVGLAAALIFVVAFLDYPLDTGSRLASRWSRGKPAWQESVPGKEAGMTRGLFDGLRWMRDHTRKSSVVAVNNPYIVPGFARYFYYAAFGERRTYLGGWEYSERAAPVLKGKPLPADLVYRLQASVAAATGNPQAIHALASAGVSYLLVDKLNAQYGDATRVGAVVRPVFENDAVAIYPVAGL